MKAIKTKMYEEYIKSINLRKKSAPLPTLKKPTHEEFEKQMKIRKEQDKHYKKWKFFKKLNQEMEKKNERQIIPNPTRIKMQ